MLKTISEKQLMANRENAKKGGVKTKEGKEVSKMNALSFGVYSPNLLDEKEHRRYNLLVYDLTEEYQVAGISEESLIHQIALYEIKLQRVSLMEEYYHFLASLKSVSIIQKNFIVDEESDELDRSMYDYFMKNSHVLKVRELDVLEKIQKYREMLENRKVRCLSELMNIKYFKKKIDN